MGEIVLILLPPVLKCFMKVKRSTTGGRRLQPEPTEPLEMPFQLRAGGAVQSPAERVCSAELRQTPQSWSDSQREFPPWGRGKRCFVPLSNSVEGNAVRCLLQGHVDKQSASVG